MCVYIHICKCMCLCIYVYLYIWDYYSDDLFSSSILQSENTLCCIQNRMYNDCVEYAFQRKEKDGARSAIVACLLFQPIKTNTKAPTNMLIPVRHFSQLSLKDCDLISSQNQLWHFVSPLPLPSTSQCSRCFFLKIIKEVSLKKTCFQPLHNTNLLLFIAHPRRFI